MKLKKTVTFDEVRKSKSDTIYFSAHTCWWTDDPQDLQPGIVPHDVFGSPLFEAPKHKFMDFAEQNPRHYGAQGLHAFMAAHHKNFELEDIDRAANHNRYADWRTFGELAFANRIDYLSKTN